MPHVVHSMTFNRHENTLSLPHKRNACNEVTVSNVGSATAWGSEEFVHSAINSHTTEPKYPAMRYRGDTTSLK